MPTEMVRFGNRIKQNKWFLGALPCDAGTPLNKFMKGEINEQTTID